MPEGVYALIGVVVGGFLNAGVGLATDWLARKRTRRVAARRLLARLSQAADHMRPGAVLGAGALGEFSGRDALAQFWAQHETLFAGLGRDDWVAVQDGVRAALTASTGVGDRAKLSEVDQKVYEVDLNSVENAERVLRKVAHVPPRDAEIRAELTAMLQAELKKRTG